MSDSEYYKNLLQEKITRTYSLTINTEELLKDLTYTLMLERGNQTLSETISEAINLLAEKYNVKQRPNKVKELERYRSKMIKKGKNS